MSGPGFLGNTLAFAGFGRSVAIVRRIDSNRAGYAEMGVPARIPGQSALECDVLPSIFGPQGRVS